MAIVASQSPSVLIPLVATANAASGGGDKVSPGVLLRVINADSVPHTLTVVTPSLAAGSQQITVANPDAEAVRSMQQ